MKENSYVYITTNKPQWVLYIWVTSNLVKRIYEHKNHIFQWFTKKYDVTQLVYFEVHDSIEAAILREKQIKKWNRDWKIEMIEKMNSDWKDLYSELV